jgi:hypothetical protein
MIKLKILYLQHTKQMVEYVISNQLEVKQKQKKRNVKEFRIIIL